MVDCKAELLRLGNAYQNLVLLVANLPDRGLVSEFESFFPGRIFYFSNGERNMLASAAGFCLAGKLPLVLGSDLLLKGAEQVVSMLVEPKFNARIWDLGDSEKGDLRRQHQSSLVTVSGHTAPAVASRFLASHPFSESPLGSQSGVSAKGLGLVEVGSFEEFVRSFQDYGVVYLRG